MAKHGLWTDEEVVQAFKAGEPLAVLSKRVGGSPNTIRRVLKINLGENGYIQRRGNNRPTRRAWKELTVTSENIHTAFYSDVGFIQLAKNFKMSPNTLHKLWVKEFGEAAVKARSLKHLIDSGEKTGFAGRGLKKSRTIVTSVCAECGSTFDLSRMSKSKSRKFVCPSCKNKAIDRFCPICGVGCEGKKGLATHFRHYTDDPVHSNYFKITREDLLRFTLKNGKVVIGWAVVGLGKSARFIKKEARRHGLETYGRYTQQNQCLAALAQALDNTFFIQEWMKPELTGKYRFDGYFPSYSLVVEFQGYQHWTFPNVYCKSKIQYLKMLERDQIKATMIHSDPNLYYFVVRGDEPFTDVSYLRRRLISEGVINVR